MADQLMNVDASQSGSEEVNFACEPDATKLVVKIQDNGDIQENKESLVKLILPFISQVVGYNLPSFYSKSDADDAVQEFIYKHIMNDDISRRAKMHLYRYDHSRNTPFCGYLKIVLRNFCAKWKRDYCEGNHRGHSLNDDSDTVQGKGASLCKFEVSQKKFEQEESQRDFIELIRLLAANYLQFFNAVNSLDKEKTYGKPFQDGERIVNEQKLLAYHIRFINSEFLLSPKSRSYSVDRLRAFPYIRVNHSNDDYLRELFGLGMDFMKLLEERIHSRDLAEAVFLPPEKDIRTTVDEWLRSPRMKDRIDKEYAKLKVDNVTFRKDYFYGI